MVGGKNAFPAPNPQKKLLLAQDHPWYMNMEPGKKWEQQLEGEPSLYVGETSRSIQERTKEHWRGMWSKSEKNHIWKHQVLVHGGSQEPKFLMMPVKYYRTALARQVGEVVRIRRRGGEGALLNSKGEFNRSHIPRLTIQEELPPEGALASRLEEQEKLIEKQGAVLKTWEQNKTRERNLADLSKKGSQTKRRGEPTKEGGEQNFKGAGAKSSSSSL